MGAHYFVSMESTRVWGFVFCFFSGSRMRVYSACVVQSRTYIYPNTGPCIHYCRVQEVCERRGGCPGLPSPNSLCGLCGRKATLNECWKTELRSCVKIEVVVLGSPSLIVPVISVDVRQHWTNVEKQSSGAVWKSFSRGRMHSLLQSSGAVWRSRWSSWALRP